MNNKGLTLVELLIVIVIMGIITSFAVVSVSEILDDSKKKGFVVSSNGILDAAENAYSTADSLWDDDIATLGELVDGKYITTIGKDPWGGEYKLDETYVTVENVIGIDNEPHIYLSMSYYPVTGIIFKCKIVSTKAVIGYNETLSVFDKTDVYLLDSSDGSILDKITEVFDNSLDENVNTNDGDDEIEVNEDIKDNASITTNGGDDTINIGDDVKDDASIDMGSGNDVLNMDGEVRDDAQINTGDGDDILNIKDDIQDDAIVNTGADNGTVTIGDDLQNGAELNTGSGDDTVTIKDDLDKAKLYTGDGNDTVDVDTLKSSSTINTGSDNDELSIRDINNNYKGTTKLGSGNDTLTINDRNFSRIKGTFDGGSGDDTLYLQSISLKDWNKTYHKKFTGFETIVLKDTTLYQ